MRRFSTATVLGGLLLLGAGWSLAASDTPKVPRPAARRKAVAPKRSGKIDVELENLYVDSEIGQVFTVNLGRADQQASSGESVASLGGVQIYRLGGSEVEPPETEGAGQADPADPAVAADDDEMEPAPEAAGDEAMAPAADDSAQEPAAEAAAAPEAAPQTGQTPPQPESGVARPPAAPAVPAAKAAPRTPPPAASSQAPPPAPPPIR